MEFFESPANKRITGYHSGPKINDNNHRVFIETCNKRIRLKYNETFVVDSVRSRLLFEDGHIPMYYFPKDDIETKYLSKTDLITNCPYKGNATYWTLEINGRQVVNAAWSYEKPLDSQQQLKGLIAFYWKSIDNWYEEEEEIFSHPKDPYVRLDAIKSKRKIRVFFDGVLVTESTNCTILFQTGLPPQYYFSKNDIIPELKLLYIKSRCAYKGIANHFTLNINNNFLENIASSFTNPPPEMSGIKDLICFDHNKINTVVYDSGLISINLKIQ